MGIGLTQLEAVNALVVVGWLLALGVRSWLTLDDRDWAFNFMQIGLAIWTGFALLSLLVSVQQGLLGFPHMQIAGNGSSASRLLWYQDRDDEILPQAWVLSVPMMVYRLLMLAWAFGWPWLFFAVAAVGWEAFSRGGFMAAGQDPGGCLRKRKSRKRKQEDGFVGAPSIRVWFFKKRRQIDADPASS